jgi:hypothetical protein
LSHAAFINPLAFLGLRDYARDTGSLGATAKFSCTRTMKAMLAKVLNQQSNAPTAYSDCAIRMRRQMAADMFSGRSSFTSLLPMAHIQLK